MKRQILVLVVVVLPICTTPVIASIPAYTITDLGTLGGNASWAYAINDGGQVVGESLIAGNSARHAFLFDGSIMRDLGTLGKQTSKANSINNAGQIVGYITDGSSLNAHAFVWENGVMSELIGGAPAEAAAINNAGQIAGFTGRPGVDGIYACIWENGVKFDLSTMFSGTSRCTGINNQGQVIGFSYGNQNGFLWDPVNGRTYLGTNRQPHAINDNGQIVLTGSGTIFLYEGGVMNNLNYRGYPKSINNSGQIVGATDSEIQSGFLWEDGTFYTLDELLMPGFDEWDLTNSYAYCINNLGQIAGRALINGQQHAFLMTPVPEPGTVALLAVGAVMVLRKRK